MMARFGVVFRSSLPSYPPPPPQKKKKKKKKKKNTVVRVGHSLTKLSGSAYVHACHSVMNNVLIVLLVLDCLRLIDCNNS